MFSDKFALKDALNKRQASCEFEKAWAVPGKLVLEQFLTPVICAIVWNSEPPYQGSWHLCAQIFFRVFEVLSGADEAR